MKELTIIQGKLNAPKGQYNRFGKYRYRSCEDILAAVKPLLAETGCMITLTDDLVMVGQRYYVKATATLTNAQGVQVTTTAYAREEDTKKGMDDSQVTGASSSYARKYALNGLLAIDDQKDSDYTNNTVADVATGDGIDGAVADVMSARDRDGMVAAWRKWNRFKDEKRFKDAIEAKKKELGL